MNRRPLLKLVTASIALTVALVWAPSVSAHAALAVSDPAPNSVVAEVPSHIDMTFTEPVQPAFGDSMQVFDADGAEVTTKAPRVKGASVRLYVKSNAEGTYIVNWRAVSQDGHPINGSFLFSVRTESTPVKPDVASAKPDKGIELAFHTSRAISLLGVLLASGGVLFSLVIVPRWLPVMIAPVLIGSILGSIIAFVCDVAVASGLTLTKVLHVDALSAELDTPFGRGMFVRIVVALVALGLLPKLRATAGMSRSGGFATFAVAVYVLLAATQSLTGHAVGPDPVGLRMPLAMVHAVAAAVWVGGLVQFRLFVTHDTVTMEEVERFSSTVLVAVMLLLATGIYAAVDEIRLSADALFQSFYGRMLLVKLLLFAACMPLAIINKRSNIPAVARGERVGIVQLRRYVRAEILLLAVIIAVTVWLIQSPPPSSFID